MSFIGRSLIAALLILPVANAGGQAKALPGNPRVLDDRLVLELVAESPDIVTPVGLTFDAKGRLLVIESHTHFPPKNYKGPAKDRIRVLEDTNGDGRADKFSSFLEGTTKTMSVRGGPDGWVYVATRMKIFRTRDSNGDGKADERQEIAELQTQGDYPHNGLCGLCFDTKGNLYFGLGENLGREYVLVGSDGKRLPGGGEGGNIYRCRLDGSKLHQVATGFWNPFGICFDTRGRLFTVGNDPDGSPPCRLVHVVEGGDFGYQFRYGRSGKHPLQAWDGELPGTLPMMAGTSEAPSAVVPWTGRLYTTSWGEHRIERFRLKHYGASVRADREVVVEGNNQFRPVDLAVAPDGSIYFTDWVDRSYNVHGKGRVWRLHWRKGTPGSSFVSLSDDEKRAEKATRITDPEALASSDPFLHQAAVVGYAAANKTGLADFSSMKRPRQRLGILQAARRASVSGATQLRLLQAAIDDPAADVRLYAVRWIADDRVRAMQPALDHLLASPDSTVPLFKAAAAAIEWLETNKVERRKLAGEKAIVAALAKRDQPALQVLALQTLPDNHEAIASPKLAGFIQDAGLNPIVRREAARSMVSQEGTGPQQLRRKLIQDPKVPAAIRADLISALNIGVEADRKLARRMAREADGDVKQQALTTIAWQEVGKNTQARPAVDDLKGWIREIGNGGNANRGWRVFFGQHAARCANCHRLSGRGADIGPDLTSIARRMERGRVLQSIVDPSREIAPKFVPWVIQTEAGRVFTALSLGVPGSRDKEDFLGTDGKRFSLTRSDIAARKLSDKSVMPDGLHQQLSSRDLADLLELLRK